MKKLVRRERKFNSKGEVDFLSNQIIFILLIIVFSAIIIFFLWRTSKGVVLAEQAYAKRIALVIDQAKPGTYVEINMMEIYQMADKNGFKRENTVAIDPEARKVTVKATEGRGYSFNFFNDNSIIWGLDKLSGKLTIEIAEKTGENENAVA
jgi:hypothetical protein